MAATFKAELINILEENGYRLDYTPYHNEADIKKFAGRERNLNTNCYLTVFDSLGYVICRLSQVQEKTRLEKEHIQQIVEAFRIFEIPNRDNILERLEDLL
ncbi:hypothetical protein COTS27_01607 [Spirochaetota bacterium]|nr:hypothetical protein COTS27_01607 [Spirochaetota bacterium]